MGVCVGRGGGGVGAVFGIQYSLKVNFWHSVALYEWVIAISVCVKGLVTKQFFFVCVCGRMYRHCCATYESASLRMFRLGRTDTIRSASSASAAFVKAFDDPHKQVWVRSDWLTDWSYIYCLILIFLVNVNADIHWWNKVFFDRIFFSKLMAGRLNINLIMW